MTDDTYAARKRFIPAGKGSGGHYDMETAVIASGETIKPGHVVYVDSTKQAYTAKSTDTKWSGVAYQKGGQDIDTAYTAGDQIQYYKPNGCKLNLICEATSPAVAIEEGDPIIIGTEDGKVRRFTYAGDAGDTQDLIGWADEYLLPTVGDDKILRVRLKGG